MQAIARLAEEDPTEALRLAWRFLQIATPIFRRCEDTAGVVVEVFHCACALVGCALIDPA